MEKENLPLYVHGMGRRRLSTPKEKTTEETKQQIISDYLISDEMFLIKEETKKGQIIDYSI